MSVVALRGADAGPRGEGGETLLKPIPDEKTPHVRDRGAFVAAWAGIGLFVEREVTAVGLGESGLLAFGLDLAEDCGV